MQELLILFGIGLTAGIVGTFVTGSVVLISVVSLINFGIPPHASLGIMHVGILGYRFGGLRDYIKSGNIMWPLILPLIILSVVGAFIGSFIVISLDQELLEKIIGIVVLIFIPLMLLNRNLGVVAKKVSPRTRKFGFLAFFLTTIWGSSIAVGGGIFMTYVFLYLFGSTILSGKGTDKIPGIFLDVITITVFAFGGFIMWGLAIAFFCGMFVGTTLATKLAIKVGNSWLRWFTIAAIIALAVRLLFF